MIILIELNEINFDFVLEYVKNGEHLPNLKLLTEQNGKLSSCESDYENLEPWIQWPSVHTGKTFKEHKVFRLGDGGKYKGVQLFEEIEKRGYSVGNLSAMNVVNRLKNPAFFIPDPWTDTPADRSFISKGLSRALAQTVNDNSESKITFASLFNISLASLFLILPHRYLWIIKKFFWAIKKHWRRAIFLDLLLSEFFIGLIRKKKPDFATVFLNGGAHIQHHFMLSSSIIKNKKFFNPKWYLEEDVDPLLEAYKEYDEIIGRLLSIKNAKCIMATGLSQKPFEKPVFYYRLNNHSNFFKLLGIKFAFIEPRMTRDFLVHFDDDSDRDNAVDKLKNLKIKEVPLFGQIETRPKELFVTMDYPLEISSKTFLDLNENNAQVNLSKHVSFVAIKNGEHQEKGFVFIDPAITGHTFHDGDHIAKLFDTIIEQFPDRGSFNTLT